MQLDGALQALGEAPVKSKGADWAAESARGRASQPARDELSRNILRAEGGVDPSIQAPMSQEQWSAKLGSTKRQPLDGALAALDSTASAQAETPQNPTTQSDFSLGGSARDIATHVATGLGGTIIGGWRGLAALVSGGTMDDAAKAVAEEQRTRIAPVETEAGKRFQSAMESPANPLTWVSLLAKKGGEFAQDLGASPGVATAIETGINAAPLALLRRGGAAERPAPTPLKDPPPTIGSMVEGVNYDAPTYLRRQQPQPVQATVSQAAQGPAPAALPAPVSKPALTPTQVAITSPAAGGFSQAAVENAKLLDRIGLERSRRSALEADAKAASTDYQLSKLDTEGGTHMRTQLDSERAALTNYGEKIVADTGGTLGLDQKTLMARGDTILKPLDSFRKWFDTETKKLYSEADAKAKGVPVKLDEFKATLNDDALRSNSESVAMHPAATAYAKKIGILQEDGSIAGSAAKAEQMRKYLNEHWSPQNSRYVGAMKDALDNDVFSAAGGNIYEKARAVRAMRSEIFDNPDGISKVIDSQGINRAIPIEQIADKILSMPVDQLRHIIKVLDNVPKQYAAEAAKAKAELRAHLANELLAEGNKNAVSWNAKNVRQYLDANAAKFEALFPDARELAKVNDLRRAGDILHADKSYPGASVQQHNLMRSMVSRGVEGGAAAVGAAAGGPLGAAGGNVVGRYLSGKMDSAASLRAAQKRTIRLIDALNP